MSTPSSTVFYLTARSADKPPGKGVNERLAAGENYADLALEENWRRRLFALHQHQQQLAPADLALLRLTGSAELVTTSGRCEALERARREFVAEEEEEDSEASSAATAEEDNNSEASSAAPAQEEDNNSEDSEVDAEASPPPPPPVIDLVAVEEAEAAAEALADAIAAHLVDTPLEVLARRFGGQSVAVHEDDFDETLPPSVRVPAARLRQLYQLAAHDGRRVLVRWLHHTVAPIEGDNEKWDAHATLIAAERGHRAALEFLLDAGCPADPRALCAAAARGAHSDVLRMLTEEYEAEWDERCVEALMSSWPPGGCHERFQMLMKCLTANAPVSLLALRSAIVAGDLDTCEQLYDHCSAAGQPILIATAANEDWLALAASASEGGDAIGVLRWLTTPQDPKPQRPICGEWTVSAAAAAARRRDPSVLVWLRAQGCPLDPSVALAAAQALRPDNLAFCLRNGGGVHAAAAHQAATSAGGSSSSNEEEDGANRAACIALLQPLLVSQQSFFAPRRTRAPPAADVRQWMEQQAASNKRARK